MNRLVLTCGLAAMDTFCVYPWCVLVGMWVGSGRAALLSASSVFGLVLLGALSTQALGRHARSNRLARVALAVSGLLASVVAVGLDHYPGSSGLAWLAELIAAVAQVIGNLSPPVLALALGLGLWWLGVRLGAQTATYTDVETTFRWGIGLLVGFGLIMPLSARPPALASLEGTTTPYVIGFFFVSLLTLALGRLESLRTRTRDLSVNRQWLGVLVLVAAAVVLLALLAGQLVSFDLLVVATRPLFDLLGVVLLLIIYALVIPTAYVVQWLVYLVLSLAHVNPNQVPPRLAQPGDIDNLLQRFLAEQVPPELLQGLKAAGAAVLLGLALLVVARALTRWRPTSVEAAATNEERDSVLDAGRLPSRLLAWLQRVLRWRTRAPSPPVTSAVRTPGADLALQALSIRALYARLLRLGEAAGAPRARATTPLEHVAALERVMEPEQTIADLTYAYVRVRYAESEPTPAETTTLRQALDDVRPKGLDDAVSDHP